MPTPREFFTYRGMVRCTCGRVYTPCTKKSINYYTSKCKPKCDNTKRNIREADIDKEVESLLDQIHFTDEELAEIEERAKSSLDTIHNKRSKELDDLNKQRKRVYEDLNYLTKNKLTLLRTKAMTPEAINQDESRLTNELEEVEQKTAAHKEGAAEMLEYVVTFSELVKMTKVYYKHALDSEKQEIAAQVFSKLSIYSGKLANFTAKEGFAALFNRHGVKDGAPTRIRT